MYLNGTFDDGQVRKVSKDSQGVLTNENFWVLRKGETDSKLFSFIQFYCFTVEDIENILIFSQDTDVKILAIHFSACSTEKNIVIRHGQNLNPSYFYPRVFIEYLEKNFKLNDWDSLMQHVGNLVETYIMFGSDHNLKFENISHSFALTVWNELSRTMILSTEDDFLLLVLKIYEKKYKEVKRFFDTKDTESPIEERIMRAWAVIKSYRALESSTIPLPSVLRLQLQRASSLRQILTNPDNTQLDPEDFGWTREGEEYNIKLQDGTDEYYTLPKDILHGCQCKGTCQTKKCSCNRVAAFSLTNGLNCSRWTCRFKCFETESDVVDTWEEDDLSSDSGEESDLEHEINYFPGIL